MVKMASDPCAECKECIYQKYGFIALNVWGLLILVIVVCAFWRDCVACCKGNSAEEEKSQRINKDIELQMNKVAGEASTSIKSQTIKTQLSTSCGPIQQPIMIQPPQLYSPPVDQVEPLAPSPPLSGSPIRGKTTVVHLSNQDRLHGVNRMQAQRQIGQLNSNFMPAPIAPVQFRQKQPVQKPPQDNVNQSALEGQHNFQTLYPQPDSPESPASPSTLTAQPTNPQILKHESTGSNYFKQIMKGRKPVASISQYMLKRKKKNPRKKKVKKKYVKNITGCSKARRSDLNK